MKNIGIVSCYFKMNYGSMLQAFATQRFMDNLGLRNETINLSGISREIFRGKRKYYRRNLLNLQMYQAKKGFIRHIVQRKLDRNGFGKNIVQRNHAFRNFEDRYFRLSKPCSSIEELSSSCRQYTDVLLGSDQLWLPLNIEGDYYTLNFVPDLINKVAFATSFGVSEIPLYLQEKTACFLSHIQHLSVREKSGQQIIEQLTGRQVPIVCDPSLLFTGDEWGSIQSPEAIISHPYIFCYLLGNNPSHRSFANRLKQETGLPIVVLRHLDEYIPSDEAFGDEAPYDIGPLEFLNLIHHAKFVCTDSFHGTVFSILNKKPFFTFKRFQKNNAQSTNARLDTFLSTAGLIDRYIQGDADVSALITSEIDYQTVDKKIRQLRENSIRFLTASLGITERV